VRADEGEVRSRGEQQGGWKHPDVEGEEAVRDLEVGAASGSDRCQRGSDHRDGGEESRVDSSREHARLIPGQRGAGGCESEDEREHEGASDPGELTGATERARSEGDPEVQQGESDEEVAAESVQSAHEPSEGHLGGEVSDTLPSVFSRTKVDQQEQSCDRLHEEAEQREAGEVPAESGTIVRHTK